MKYLNINATRCVTCTGVMRLKPSSFSVLLTGLLKVTFNDDQLWSIVLPVSQRNIYHKKIWVMTFWSIFWQSYIMNLYWETYTYCFIIRYMCYKTIKYLKYFGMDWVTHFTFDYRVLNKFKLIKLSFQIIQTISYKYQTPQIIITSSSENKL